MRTSQSDRSSRLSVSPDLLAHASPSGHGPDTPGPSNGHTNGNGLTNGATGNGIVAGNGIQKLGKAVARVDLPGTTLYDDSFVDREEFVRLVIQSLRDVGYMYVVSMPFILFLLNTFA